LLGVTIETMATIGPTLPESTSKSLIYVYLYVDHMIVTHSFKSTTMYMYVHAVTGQ